MHYLACKAERKYVREYLVCQQCKFEQRAPAGLMGKREISRSWQVVAADITGPLPKNKHGFEYVLVFEDLFSGWVEVIRVESISEEFICVEIICVKFVCVELICVEFIFIYLFIIFIIF